MTKKFLMASAVLLLLYGCRENRNYLRSFDAVEAVVSDAPQRALAMLDSLKETLPHTEEALRHWQLMWTRATDKACDDTRRRPLKNDSTMGEVVKYFEAHGTPNERLLAYYYMGSACRDRNDSPQAVLWYRKAADYGIENLAQVDSAVVSCVLIQLAYVFTQRGDYHNSLNALKKNLELMRGKPHYYETHEVAGAYRNLYNYDTTQVAYRDSAFLFFTENLRGYQSRKIPLNVGYIAEALGFYVATHHLDEAAACIDLLRSIPEEAYQPNAYVNLGHYYFSKDMPDSTEYYWRHAYERSVSTLFRNNAAFHLSSLYNRMGNAHEELRFLRVYKATQDTLNETLKAEQTTNANNLYQYERNLQREELLERKAQAAIWTAIAAVLLTFAAALAVGWCWRRQKKVERMEFAKQQQQTLQLYWSDIVEKFRQMASDARPSPKQEDWEKLQVCIEQISPGFTAKVRERIPNIKPDNLQYLLLWKAGLTNKQVASLKDTGPAAVSQRRHRLEQQLDCTVEEL